MDKRDITITLSAEDATALDIAARKIMSSAKEAGEVYIQVLPVKAVESVRVYIRKVTVVAPTDKTVAALARVDVPKNITIFIR